MNLSKIGLSAIDVFEPTTFLSSDELEKELSVVYDRLKLPYGRIEMQTGIKSRGIFPEHRPSSISASAAKKLFENSHINADEIDLLIHASVCRDFLEPSTSSVIHHELNLRSDCLSFDLSNACLGVVNAIHVAANMLMSSEMDKALIVTGENSYPLYTQTIKTLLEDSSITRKTIKKFFANFTIGSAGVAIVISKSDHKLATFDEFCSLSDSSAHVLCQGDGSTDSLVMETDSEALMQAGVKLAKQTYARFRQKVTMEADHYICHQVGIHHRNFLYESLELDLEKDTTTFDKYGNTGSAALPLTLKKAEPKFQQGDYITLMGIGSGLHTIVMGLKWN